MRWVVIASMILMGIGIAAVWTRDILAGDQVDLSGGFFRARDPGSGSVFWPHWLAEYGTAVLLIVAGFGLWADTQWSHYAGAAGLGALLYTSINSLGWVLAEPERKAYAVPMAVGVVVGVIGLIWLIV